MERWLHEVMDWFCLGRSKYEIHRQKDLPSRLPPLGKSHRMIRHSEWKEWARVANIEASEAVDLLSKDFTKYLLGDYAKRPIDQIPPSASEAALSAIISVSHEALDQKWSEAGPEMKTAQEIFWALYALDDEKWSPDILLNPAFCRLQNYIVWKVLPNYYIALKGTRWEKEIEEKVSPHLWIRSAMEAGKLNEVLNEAKSKLRRISRY